jgi:hypothetical protein
MKEKIAYYVPDFQAHPEFYDIESWDDDLLSRTGYTKEGAIKLIKTMRKEFPRVER